jgi:hypothetical protein
VGQFSLGVIVVGVAVIGAFVAMAITLFVIITLLGHFWILGQACSVSPSGRQVCSPRSPWIWAIPGAGVLGAAAGAIGASLISRNRVRPPVPTIFD